MKQQWHLDVGINEIFGRKLNDVVCHDKNSLFLIDKKFKVTKDYFIIWISEILWKEDIITVETIQKKFLK